jgi:hypothetical protein
MNGTGSGGWFEAELKAEHLRREIYLQDDPAKSQNLLDAMQAAEKEALRLKGAAAADPGATILSTTAGLPTNLLSAETTGLIVEVKLRMAQIPGSIVHLLDGQEHPLVEVSAKNGKADRIRRVRVTTYVEGYSASTVDTIELAIAAPAYKFLQLPTFFPDSLSKVTELTRATVNVCVQDLDGKVELQNTKPVWIAPRTTAVLSTRDPATGKFNDFTPYLAAFVTPNDPSIMGFLRTAAKLHPSGRLVGYQGNAAVGVADQVEALYQALKQDGNITYINSVISFGAENGVSSQRVRLPRESLATQSANCIDGTVLFASLLEAESLNPAIVIVPGHAFAAWETWTGSGQWKYLETTMIGTHDFASACQSAEALANIYGAINPSPMIRRSVPDLRAKGIYPMP